MTLGFAHQERQSRYDSPIGDAGAPRRRGLLEGEKSVVLPAIMPTGWWSRRAPRGDRSDRSGIGLFLVDARAKGISRRGYPTQDACAPPK